MPRDYAKKSRPARAESPRANPPTKKRPARSSAAPSHRQSGGLSVRWILSLAAVGGFIGFILYLNTINPQPGQATPPAVNQAPQTATSTTPPASSNGTQEQQGFRFYEMLPDSEVIPSDVEEYTPGPAQQEYNYVVQTGSFRSQSDAERQRAQIAFQGLRAKVSRIDLDSGSIWYRVNVGPFTSRSQMNAAVDKLVSINIEPLVRKIPKEG